MKEYHFKKRAHLFYALFVVLSFLCYESRAIEISDVTIYQMDFYGKYDNDSNIVNVVTDTNWGDFEVELTPDSDPCDYYLNLMIRRDGYGEHWVICNMAVPNSGQICSSCRISRFFDLGYVGITTGTELSTIDYSVIKSPDILTEQPASPNDWQTTDVANGHYNAFGLNDANGTLQEPNYPPAPPVPDIPGEGASAMVLLSANGSGSSGKSKYYENVPDVEEPERGCGPGSVRRGLKMLADNNDISVEDMNDTMEKFEEMSEWNPEHGIRGVKRFLTGKAAIAEDVNIVTKYQQVKNAHGAAKGNVCVGNGLSLYKGEHPCFDFIKQEIDAGEAVEILCYPDGPQTIGHAVTCTGYDSETKQIRVKDDPNQGKADGNRERNTRFTDGDNPKLDDLPIENIDAIVSQSPIGDAADCNFTPGGRPNEITGEWEKGDQPPPGTTVEFRSTNPISITVKRGATIRFFWTAEKLRHPEYKQAEWTNNTSKSKVVKFYTPKDPSITDYRYWITGRGWSKPKKVTIIARFVVDSGSGTLSFNSIGNTEIDPFRIPCLLAATDDVNVYCAVDLQAYANNPTGFLGTQPLEPNTTIGDLGVVIEDGQVQGVDGIYWALCPFEFDPNSETGWVVDDPNCLLDSSDFEAQYGQIYIDGTIAHYLDSDIDEDFDVDLNDYSAFAGSWRQSSCTKPSWCNGADLDKSGFVEFLDLAVMAENWMETLLPDLWFVEWACATQCHGDADCTKNGPFQVSLSDLNILKAAMGTSYPDPNYDPRADSNRDGQVTQDDNDILQEWFNKIPGPPADCPTAP